MADYNLPYTGDQTAEYLAKARDFSGEPLGDGLYTSGKTYTTYDQYLNDGGALFKLNPAVALPYAVNVSLYPQANTDPNLIPYVSFESNAGWDLSLGDFAVGVTLAKTNQVLRSGSFLYRTSEALPYITNGATPVLDTGEWLVVEPGAERVKTFVDLSAAVTSDELSSGDVLDVKERTPGNGGGAIWDVALSSGVTPNAIDIVQCTGIATLALVLRKNSTTTIKELGAIGDGTDATDEIEQFKQAGEVASQPDGDYPDTRNGEFYLYAGSSDRGNMGYIRHAVGGTADKVVNDGRPVMMLEKVFDYTKGSSPFGNYDAGCLLAHAAKKGGDGLVTAASAYAKDEGGTGGDVIGMHQRAKGSHVDAEIFGGWSYADIDPGATGLITEGTGHEIDVKNASTDTPPFNNRVLPAGVLQGEYRGLIIVTADSSNPCNLAMDIGAQSGSQGWYTGLRLRELAVVPSDDVSEDTCQQRIQGGTTDALAYGGLTFDYGNFTYGINMEGGTYRNGQAIRLKSGDGLFVDGNQVVSDQQAAIADSVGGDEQAKINAILAALRAHGLINT